MTTTPSFYLPKKFFNGKESVMTSVNELKPYVNVPGSVKKTLRNILFTQYFPGYSAPLNQKFELAR